MKKIFAIALALVMVLSMASAFASPCTAGFDWTKTDATNCGQAKIEVVPYVKVNNGCGGFKWQVSDCAGAVTGENIYYAMKLTVDANPDADWFEAIAQDSDGTSGEKVKVTFKGTTGAKEWDLSLNRNNAGNIWAATNTEDAVWYYNTEADEWFKVGTEAGQISVADDVEATSKTTGDQTGSEYIMKAVVSDSSNVKICAEIASKYDFVRGTVGKYYVEYITEDGALVLKVWEKQTATNPLAVYTIANDKVVKVDYTNAGSCAPYDVASIKAFFGIYEGTTITTKLVNKNFGWDNKISDCNTWSSNVTAIVDAECVVAIPKTGDASVLAWLF